MIKRFLIVAVYRVKGGALAPADPIVIIGHANEDMIAVGKGPQRNREGLLQWNPNRKDLSINDFHRYSPSIGAWIYSETKI